MQSEINKALLHLKKGNLILCPTDTIWGISCDALNFNAVEKIYKIKKRDKSKSLVILVSNIEMLNKYIESLPKGLNDVLAKQTKAVTIVYPKAKNLPSNVYSIDNSIAIRIVKEGFVKTLISSFGKPIISTSANLSGKRTPKVFSEIESELKQKLDFIVDEKFSSVKQESSTILKYDKESYVILRK